MKAGARLPRPPGRGRRPLFECTGDMQVSSLRFDSPRGPAPLRSQSDIKAAGETPALPTPGETPALPTPGGRDARWLLTNSAHKLEGAAPARLRDKMDDQVHS